MFASNSFASVSFICSKIDFYRYLYLCLLFNYFFVQIIKNAEIVRKNLMSLNCFENVSVHIDVNNDSNSTPNGYKVF